MIFGKKREKELPDLPPPAYAEKKPGIIPPVETPEPREERALPSFPNSPSPNKFSEAMIKDAVIDKEEKEQPTFPEVAKEEEEQRTLEMEEWKPNTIVEARRFPVPSEDLEEASSPPPFQIKQRITPIRKLTTEENIVSQLNDVYVKIDKFHLARRTMRDITEKLAEIDSIIKRIRETKLREEQELTGWERDIAHVKARVKEVTETIFEKVE